MSTISKLGKIGPYHADIDGLTQTGGIRGPFEHVGVDDTSAVTYPMLWNHEAARERCMCFEGDSEGLVRTGASANKIANIWKSRSHCHFNQNLRFNSQSTPMQFTQRSTLGGRAWTSIQLSDIESEKVLVAWANTSLGILLHWYHANKQQSGRGNVVPTSLTNLPVIDVKSLTSVQVAAAVQIFDDFCYKELLTIENLDLDPVRHELDRRFLSEIIGLPQDLLGPGGPVDLMRKKLCQEPSMTGRRKGTAKRKPKDDGPIASSKSKKAKVSEKKKTVQLRKDKPTPIKSEPLFG